MARALGQLRLLSSMSVPWMASGSSLCLFLLWAVSFGRQGWCFTWLCIPSSQDLVGAQ